MTGGGGGGGDDDEQIAADSYREARKPRQRGREN